MCFTKDFPCLCGIHYPPTDHVRSSLWRIWWTSLPYHLYRQSSGPTSYGSSAGISRTFGTTTTESGLSGLTIKRSRLCDSFVARSERCEHVGVTKIGCERSCTYFPQNSTVPCERALATIKDNSEAMPHQHFESQSHVFASPGSNRLPAYASTTLQYAYDPPAVIIIGGMFNYVDADRMLLLTRTVSMKLCNCTSSQLYDTLLISLLLFQCTVSEIVL
jgi:hypothetical protein